MSDTKKIICPHCGEVAATLTVETKPRAGFVRYSVGGAEGVSGVGTLGTLGTTGPGGAGQNPQPIKPATGGNGKPD